MSSIFVPNIKLVDDLLTARCEQLKFDPKQVFTDLHNDFIQKTIIQHTFSLTDRPEQHAQLAGAIAMWQHYRTCPTTVREYLNCFRPYFRDDVVAFLDEHAETLQQHIQFEKDFEYVYFSVGTLIESCLARLSYDQDPIEIPQFIWLRVAVGEFCSRDVPGENKLENVLRIYRRFSNGQGIPASPTIYNMGFKEGATASCLIFTNGDSMEDILHTIYDAGMGSKNNAGLGMDFSGLRHSEIGRHGMSQGIIPLLKVWDDLTRYINQGGRRPGVKTASNKAHHYDTPEFIRIVDKVGEDQTRANKINTSLVLSDLFMKRCLNGEKWTLFCPKQTNRLNNIHGEQFEEQYIEYERKAEIWKEYQKYITLKRLQELNGLTQDKQQDFIELEREFANQPVPQKIYSRTIDADTMMNEICEMETKVGMPYIIHGDNVNRKNNMCNVRDVVCMNLCQEIAIPAVAPEDDTQDPPMAPSDAPQPLIQKEIVIPPKGTGQTGCCILTSQSLKACVCDGKFDFNEFGAVTRDFVICLNQVMDDLRNVSTRVKRSNGLNRPIGIGVSGLAEMCHLLDLAPVDTFKLPKKVGINDEGDPIYRYVDLTQEAPDYDEEALKERVLNPKLAELNWMIWSCMYYNALLSSKDEAKIYGPYPNFWTSPTAAGKLQYHLWQEEEKETGRKYPFKLYPASPKEWGQEGSWDELIAEIRKYGLRNALHLTCMPTASTAHILGNCESTEFHMQNIYSRKLNSGEYPVMNFYLVRDLQEIDLWNENTYNNIVKNEGSVLYLPEDNLSQEQKVRLRFLKEKYLTMWEIPQRAIIELAAQRQVFIDHSQSMNIYIKYPTKDTLKAIHMFTWEMGLKTGMYYLRRRSDNDFLSIGSSKKGDSIEAEIRKLLDKGSLVDEYDPEIMEMLKLMAQAQQDQHNKEQALREEIITNTLMTASRPQEVNICRLGENGICTGCV